MSGEKNATKLSHSYYYKHTPFKGVIQIAVGCSLCTLLYDDEMPLT